MSGLHTNPGCLDAILSRAESSIHMEMWQAENLLRQMIELKTIGRPFICTEWLARTRGTLVGTNLSVFAQAKVGRLNWGLVAGN